MTTHLRKVQASANPSLETRRNAAARTIAAAIVCLFACGTLAAQNTDLTDPEIRRLLIRQSIASYSGSCPCPYSRTRNGSRCGARSAYSRPGGASPLCYDDDVTDEMINRYRESNRRGGE